MKDGFFNKIKRSKTAFLQALPIKLAVQVFRMSEVSRTNEAEKVEFSRLSIIRLKAYLARKEGRTDPQAGVATTIAKRNLCFIVCYCKAVNGWSATRSCEWVGSPLKRRRKVPCVVIFRLDYRFIARHFHSAPKRSARSALVGGKSVRKKL